MSRHTQSIALAALLAALLVGWGTESQAQFNFGNNNPGFVSGMTQAQYMNFLQQAAAAKAALQGQPLLTGYGLGLNAANPYTPVTGSAYGSGANPYSPTTSPYDTGYNPYYPPYGYGMYDTGTGSILRGQADVMRAFGTVVMNQEQARILREQANQAKLDTKKKRFDLEMYIKANTPTFTEEQIKNTKMTLKRLHNGSSEAEIVSGTALNTLLADIGKHRGKKAPVEPIALGDDTLAHLNLTKGTASLGVLRNGGQFMWPVVLQENFPAEQLRLIENQARILVKNADQSKIDVNVVREMRNEIDKMQDQLQKKISDIPPTQMVEAKRFLRDMDSARQALERGEAMTQVNFQKWSSGGKTLQQLADYMVNGGLVFAPSSPGDEFAYRAVYSGLVALDVGFTAQSPTPGYAQTEDGQPKQDQ